MNNIKDDNYKRPILTYTDKLSKKQIKELLYDYDEIKDIDELKDVQIGTHIRYFEKKNNELKFRTGGILTVNTGLPKYIVLNNGRLSWSVQVESCIFFRRITLRQIREEYDKVLTNNNMIIKGQEIMLRKNNEIIKKLKQENKKLKQEISKLT